jgi:3-dehydroquinate dehydratase-2
MRIGMIYKNGGIVMNKVLVIHGPNLNMLGTREPEIYGTQTLEDINDGMKEIAIDLGIELLFFQSNSEGDIVTKIQQAMGKIQGIIINAGGYTHTSVAIADAISAVKIPTVEVHLSNLFARESFRHHSYLSPVCVGLICGFGSNSYLLAVSAIDEIMNIRYPIFTNGNE